MRLFRFFKRKKKVEDLFILTILLKGIMGKQPRIVREVLWDEEEKQKI